MKSFTVRFALKENSLPRHSKGLYVSFPVAYESDHPAPISNADSFLVSDSAAYDSPMPVYWIEWRNRNWQYALTS